MYKKKKQKGVGKPLSDRVKQIKAVEETEIPDSLEGPPPNRMIFLVVEYLQNYEGKHTYLRELARKARGHPQWIPSDPQVWKVAKIVKQLQDNAGPVERRRRYHSPIPDSLADPESL